MFTTLTASDGHSLACWMQPAQGPARGGLVIAQEIFGVTDQLKEVARRYAAQGYAVAIPALFDRVERDAVVDFTDFPRGVALMQATDRAGAIRDIGAAVAALAAQGLRVGVMGFCWGGGLAVQAAQELPVAGAISFYGTRLEPLLDTPLKAPVLAHFGLHDDHTPAELVARMRTLPGYTVFTYDAGHAFANEARAAVYVPEAAALAHRRSAELMGLVLG